MINLRFIHESLPTGLQLLNLCDLNLRYFTNEFSQYVTFCYAYDKLQYITKK